MISKFMIDNSFAYFKNRLISNVFNTSPNSFITITAITIKNTKLLNIVAGKCGNKIISPLVYDKIMDSKFFEKWFKEMFLNEVEENKAIVMDNTTFHCKSRLYELCKNANKNLKLIFLPPYSPDLNPIEKYWASLKKNLKKINKNNRSLEEYIYQLFNFNCYKRILYKFLYI